MQVLYKTKDDKVRMGRQMIYIQRGDLGASLTAASGRHV
jgi:hypothetical protein